MFAGLALKRRWQQRRRAAGADTARPNLVMGINVQVCWDKFCNFWEVEPRLAPMAGERFHLDAEQAVSLCDENTIGVVAVLGSTFDGSYEPVAEIAAALDELQARTGLDVPVHVDGASGGMVAPFLDPDLLWDFRLPRVASINTSGHKYGLVYPGVGWVLWRDADALPEELVFKVNYLGGDMPTFALNFSRPGAQVVAQYYNVPPARPGGFPAGSAGRAATSPPTLSERIGELGPFRLLTKGDELPVFAFTLHDDVTDYSVFDVSAALRERGWQVPAYTFPADRAGPRCIAHRGAQRNRSRDGRPLVGRPRTCAAPAAAAGRTDQRNGREGLRPRHCATEGLTEPDEQPRLGPNPHARLHGLRATTFVDHVREDGLVVRWESRRHRKHLGRRPATDRPGGRLVPADGGSPSCSQSGRRCSCSGRFRRTPLRSASAGTP